MTIAHVFFTSREHAESLAGDPAMAVISITDPGTPPARLDPLFLHVLRIAFFDAVPADEFMPPLPGLFDLSLARRVAEFVQRLHEAPETLSVMVHCEYGISRSAAVALFVEAFSGAPLAAREFTGEANHWVLDRLLVVHPHLQIDVPPREAARERRLAPRPQ